MKKLLLLFSIIIFSSGVKPEKINTPDAGFKYKISFEKTKNMTLDKNLVAVKLDKSKISEMDAELSRLDFDSKDKSPGIIGFDNTHRAPISIGRECYFFISDAYMSFGDEDTSFDQVQQPPLFKKGDEGKFCKWIRNKYRYFFNTSMILSEANRGHLLSHIVIDDNGVLSEIKPLSVDDGSLNNEVYHGFTNLLKKSPKWKPAVDDGKKVESNYIIALVWGHYRFLEAKPMFYDMEEDELPESTRNYYERKDTYKYFEEAMEQGIDPLSILID